MKGKSGFVPVQNPDNTIDIVHVSACYDADGKVFVEEMLIDEETGESIESWMRINLEEATTQNRKIIECSFPKCKKPAVRLDHHHGYMDDFTNCEEHMDWPIKTDIKETL